MRVGVILPSDREWPEVLELARAAEEAGADSVWAPDAFTDGALESLTAMTALAASTERVEIGAYMLNPSLRDRSLLVRSVGSLDRIAPGRVRVLLGTGWHRADYEALGRDFPSPNARLEDTEATLAALKDHAGVPVAIAGVRDEHLSLAARADGWAISADALDAFYERIAYLERRCESVGRKLADVRVSCTIRCAQDACERAVELAAHGMDELHFPVPEDDADVPRIIARIRSGCRGAG